MGKALGMFAAVCLLLPDALAGDVSLRLVDAPRKVPLEYWEKDVDLPGQGKLLYRAPDTVYVDGKALEYGSDFKQQATLKQDEAAEDNDELLDELAGKSKKKGKEQEIRSDRAQDVLSGFKAEVHWDATVGEHVFEPGGLRFKMDDLGEVSPKDPALCKEAFDALRVLCVPVHIDFVPADSKGGNLHVSVWSGGKSVLTEETLKVAGPGASIRLYVPESKQPYTVKSGCGTASFTVEQGAIRLQGEPGLPAGMAVVVQGASLGFVAVRGRPASASPATSAEEAKTKPEPELYAFTDRNREVFIEGERVAVSVRGWFLAGAGAIPVLESAGQALEMPPIDLAAKANGLFAGEFELDTRFLGPGDYQFRLRSGEAVSNALPLRLVSALSETNLKLFAWYKWGSDTFRPDDLEVAARHGLNLVVQGAGHAQGGTALGPDGSPLQDWAIRNRGLDSGRFPELRKKPHFPVELLEEKQEHNAGAEFLLAHGIENLPVLGGMILYFNVGKFWQNHAEDRYQAVQQLGQAWRRFPNFRGMVHCVGDGPTPATSGMVWAATPANYDIIHGERLHKLREAFEHAVGKVRIDDKQAAAEFDRINQAMKGAVGFGFGMDAGLQVEGEDAVKLEWVRWLNDLYPECFRNERAALAAMMPDPVVNCGTSWGQGAGSGMWTETFYGALSHPVSDDHGDYGIVPFAYVSGIDLKSAGLGKRPWLSLDLLPERTFPNGLKLFLKAMSRNPAGIGVLNTRAEVAGGWSQRKRDSDQMMVLTDIGKRFGDLLLRLERRDEVAVLVSFRQAGTGGQGYERLWGAHFLVSKAGYQANFVSEREVLQKPELLSSYRAVMLVQMNRKLPEKLERALRDFQQKGGMVIEDQDSASGLPEVVKVECGEVRGANEVNFQKVYEPFEPLAKLFRERVRPRLKPFFEASAPHVHLVRSADGDLEYWTLFHDGLLSQAEFPNGHFAQFLYKGATADISAAAGGVLYDALRRERVEVKSVEGGIGWHADMRHLPGTLYLFASRPIAEIQVQASRKVSPGSLFHLRASLLDPDGKSFTGRAPLEIAVKSPGGETRAAVFRTTNQDVFLKIAGNDAAGQWQWRIAEQATGLAAEGTFEVQGEPVKPEMRPVRTPVFDKLAVYEALKGRNLEVLLHPEQLELRPDADQLAAELGKLGVKASVRVLLPSLTRQYRMNWNQQTIEDEEVHDGVLAGQLLGYRVKGKNQNGTFESGPDKAFYIQYAGSAEWVYYRDVILLGRGDLRSSPLLDLILRRTRMLPRNPSPNFPAPGEGFVGYAFGPFHYGHDAVVVYGADKDGLGKALGELVKLAASGKPEAEFSPVLGLDSAECGQIYHKMGFAASGEGASVRGTERSKESLLPPVFDREVLDAVAHEGRVFIRQDSKLGMGQPTHATVDLGTGTALQYRSRGNGAADFMMNVGRETWFPADIYPTSRGRLMPVERGLALFDNAGKLLWFHEPLPVSKTYEDARYARRCQRFIVSADGKRVLASFYDLNVGGGYGPMFIVFNPGVVVLLETETGKEICRYTGYCGTRLALAEDGERCVLIDDLIPTPGVGGRAQWNPHGGPVVAAFDQSGKELYHLPVTDVQRLVVSRDARKAVLSYTDARRYVSLLDIERQKEARVSYARTDVGVAVAPGGQFAVVVYTDGLVRKAAFDGQILAEKRVPAPGVPTVLEDGVIVVASADGKLYFPGSDRAPIVFASDSVKDLSGDMATIPPGLFTPQKPFWQELPKKVEVRSAEAGKANLAEVTEFKGSKELAVSLGKADGLDVRLFSFNYQLKDVKDTLRVAFRLDGETVTCLYPGVASARTATLAFRPKSAGDLALTLTAESGTTLSRPEIRLVRLADYWNATYMSPTDISKSAMVPRVMVPNIHGCLGDPRVEQMDYGFPPGWGGKLPPDLKGRQETVVKTCFDGNLYSGTPLYPAVCPAGSAPWYPAGSRSTLRSAEIIMEFDKPAPIEGIGIWEHPHDLPVRSFILEYCGDAHVAQSMTKQMVGDWKVALAPRDNTDYYHAHFFEKPISAKFWRYTITETPGLVQRVAEIELYGAGEAMFELEGAGEGGTDEGAGGL
jgi:hypothetical protein